MLFKNMEILERIFNDCLCLRVTPSLMISTPLLQISCLYICIMLRDEIDYPSFLIYPLFALDAFFFSFLGFSLAGFAWNRSVNVIQQFQSEVKRANDSNKDMKLLKKEVRAMRHIAVKFGANYVDSGLPLTLQKNAMDATLSLILMK
jgi:hypothetical protein